MSTLNHDRKKYAHFVRYHGLPDRVGWMDVTAATSEVTTTINGISVVIEELSKSF